VRLRSYFGLVTALAGASALIGFSASAAVIGSFASNGSGTNPQVTITLTGLNFGPNPNLTVGASTLTYGSGTLLAAGTTGDLMSASSLPLNDFMTFTGTPLDFTLTGLGPGSSNTNCAALMNLGTCSIPLGGGFTSPVVLELQNGSTVASLTVFGTVTDGTGVVSVWSGTLSTTLTADLSTYTSSPNVSGAPIPGDIEAYFAAHPGGAITSTHSDTFLAIIPEPTTMALVLGSLLVGVGATRRRKA